MIAIPLVKSYKILNVENKKQSNASRIVDDVNEIRAYLGIIVLTKMKRLTSSKHQRELIIK